MNLPSFNEYKEQLELIADEKQKLRKILADTGCTFPVFYGSVHININDAAFAENVTQIGHNTPLPYPYSAGAGNSVRAFINPLKRKSVGINEIALFTVKMGKLRNAFELFEVDKIVMVKDILGDDVDASDIDLSDFTVLHKIISVFSPLGIESVDEAFNKYNAAVKDIDGLREAIDKCSDSIKLFSDVREKISDTDAFKSMADSVAKAVDGWENAKIPSVSDLEKRKSEWALLEKQAEKSIDMISKVRNALKETRESFAVIYPDAADRFDSGLINDGNVRKLDEKTIDDVLSRMKYNYDRSKVGMFLSALGTSQIIALCGKPGTGKTTFAEQISKSVGAAFHLIEVQNNWTDRSDILGFYNPTNNTYQSTAFLEAVLSARDEYERNIDTGKAWVHVICLDEMNLSRVEYYFATFLSLLQRPAEERRISLLPRDVEAAFANGAADSENDSLRRYRSFILPPNVRFVGTMNMDDTAQFLSPKVIDRSLFLEFDGSGDYGINPDYHENVSEAYYLYGEFETTDSDDSQIRGAISKVSEKGVFEPTNRLFSYSSKMWEIYKKLDVSGNAFEGFIDLVLLDKVLPSLTRCFDDAKARLGGYANTFERYNEGLKRGEAANHFDTRSWSFWE